MAAPWAQASWNVASPIRLRNPGRVVIVGRRRRCVGQQPAGARGLQQRIRGGQQADGAAGVFPLPGQRRQPLQVVADA